MRETLIICAMFAFAATATAACGEKTEGGVPPCPASYTEIDDAEYECTCSDTKAEGSVWGDGVYTADSSICAAAVHAAAIDATTGGKVKLVKHDGCDRYSGSKKHGVRTSYWGKFGKSFYFAGHGDGTCAATAAVATLDDLKKVGRELKGVKDLAKSELSKVDPGLGKAVGELDNNAANAVAGLAAAGKALEADIDDKLGGAATALKVAVGSKMAKAEPLASDGDCKPSFSANGADEVTCTCGPAGGRNGVVYGAHPFTADSSICASARALGLIGADGGEVTAKAAPGCPRYEALAANGITTRSWRAYPKSFVFPAKGEALCPVLSPNDTCPMTFERAGMDTVTCMCAPKDATGALYGSHPYTTDSSICKAAKHAGILVDTAVSVTALKAPGCDKYLGTEANGVKTSAWGKYETSFVFAGEPAACPAE